MENLIKFLEDKITDKMSVEEIVDVFEQMCSTPLEEDMVLFETGTFTAFSKEPFFQMCHLIYRVGSSYLYWDLPGREKALYYISFPY